MEIILHTIHCPKCNVLEKKLQNKNVSFIKNTNEEIMKELGIELTPVLEVDGQLLDFKQANQWLEEYNGD